MTSHVTLPVLYSFRRCPYAMRARLALKSAGVQVELREVLLRDKPKQMLELSPKGTVPVLVLPTGEVIDESLDIMLWALRAQDPQHWLCPIDASTDENLAAILSLISRCDGSEETPKGFKFHLDRTKYFTRYEDADPLFSRAQAELFLVELEETLMHSKASYPHVEPVLLGASFSMADAAIAPFIRQFANIDKALFANSKLNELQQWLERFTLHPRFLAIMQKHAPWTETQSPLLF